MNTENQNSKLATFLGSRTASVTHEDGSTEEIKISQLRLADYERALPLLDDEFALTGIFCGKDKAWTLSLEPHSYEAVQALSQELNAQGFFRYAGRQIAMKALRKSLAGDSHLEPRSSASPPRPR